MSRYLDLTSSFSEKGFPPLAAFDIPHRSTLLGAWFFGEGPDIARKNWAKRTRNAWVGSPADQDGYMRLSGGGYLQTDVPEEAEITLFSISAPTGVSAGIVGTYMNGDAGASLNYPLVPATLTYPVVAVWGKSDGGNVTANFAGTATPASYAWQATSLRIPADGKGIAKNHTSNVSVTSGNTGGRKSSGRSFRIGKLYLDASYVGAVDVNLVAIFRGDMGEAATADIYQWGKAYAASRGITV